jgi:intergrase/recombinase
MVRSPGFEPGITSLEDQTGTSSGFPFSPATLIIDYGDVKTDFLKWLESRHFSEVYFKGILSYLERYVKVLQKPMDVAQIFMGLTDGQRHQLNRAVRALFNFYEFLGMDKQFLEVLRNAAPKDVVGFDVNVPSEELIVASLKLAGKAYQHKYKAAFNLAVDSGLRITEMASFIKNFDAAKLENFTGFHVAPLGYFRGTKLAYFAFFTDYTFNLLQGIQRRDIEFFEDMKIRNYFRNLKGFESMTRFKYLRKFANDTMTSEELNIPESTADFIQGRTPKSVAARHYMQLKRKAIQFYPRYAEYITRLRQKAGLTA